MIKLTILFRLPSDMFFSDNPSSLVLGLVRAGVVQHKTLLVTETLRSIRIQTLTINCWLSFRWWSLWRNGSIITFLWKILWEWQYQGSLHYKKPNTICWIHMHSLSLQGAHEQCLLKGCNIHKLCRWYMMTQIINKSNDIVNILSQFCSSHYFLNL